MDINDFGTRDNSTLTDVLTLSYLEGIMELSLHPNHSNHPPNLTTQELLELLSSQFSEQDRVDLQFFSILYKIVVPLAFAFIVLVGLVGNILVVVITLSAPDLRSTVNLLLVNLAISDISFLVLCVPLTTYHFAASRWNIGDNACRLHHYVLYVSLYSTSYTHVFIAVVRFLHIVYARRMIRLEKYTKPILAIVWIVILLFNIPILLIYRVNELDFYVYCGTGDTETNGLYLIVSFFVLSYFLPLFFISVLYVLVARHLRNKQKKARHRKKLLTSGKEPVQAITRKATMDGEGDKRDHRMVTNKSGAAQKTANETISFCIPEDILPHQSRVKETLANEKSLSPQRPSINSTPLPFTSPSLPTQDESPKSDGEFKSGICQCVPHRVQNDGQFQLPVDGNDELKKYEGRMSQSEMCFSVKRILSLTTESNIFNTEVSTTSRVGSEYRPTERKTANRKRSSHVTKLCFLVVLIFGMSWLPLQLYLIMAYCGFKPQNKWYQAYRPLCHVMAYSNASVNPIIYHYVSKDFRQSLRRTVTKFRNWWRA